MFFTNNPKPFSLNYYSNDYKPIDVNKTPFAPITIANDLYNGNIKAMAVNIPKLGTPKTYTYQYDQLNRIVAMDAYNGWNNANNTFAPQAITDYKERISYDANGNILTYQRNGDAARGLMDDMSYSYKPNTNQLDKVTDAATDVAASSYDTYKDIKQGQTNGNYTYDAIGNLVSDASEGITNIEWTVYGKISKITKVKSGVTTEIIYTYDASGNRVTKRVGIGAGWTTTFYTRDASGNVMAVYEYKQDNVVQLKELHKYGSGRLGMLSISGNEQLPVPPNVVMPYTQANSSESFGKITNFTVGTTFFELTNHLGNVLATISDRRIAIQSTTNSNEIAYYEADVVSATDYAPFGMALAGRQFSVDKYRYGFNGKELDKDVAGTSVYDYGFRIYNPALGRFLSVDPLTSDYPWFTPYQYASNNPICLIDIDGAEGGIPPLENIVVNIYISPKNYNKHNVAMLPGALQAKAQENAGRAIFALEVECAIDAYNQIYAIKQKGYIIGSIIIDSHGYEGGAFEIGEEVFTAEQAATSPILKLITEGSTGSLVLMGCQLGNNEQMLKNLADLTGRSVIADKSWTADWPGMFNDKETFRGLCEPLVRTALENGTIRDLAWDNMKWWQKLAVRSSIWGREDIIDGILDDIMSVAEPYFWDGISPSGSPDALMDSYYDPSNPSIKWLNDNIGNWVTTKKTDFNKIEVVPIEGTFILDKDGSPSHCSSCPYSQNKFGKMLKSSVSFMQELMKLLTNAMSSTTTQTPNP